MTDGRATNNHAVATEFAMEFATAFRELPVLSTQFIVGQLAEPVRRMIELILKAQDARLSLERMMQVHGEAEEDHYTVEKRRDFPPAARSRRSS